MRCAYCGSEVEEKDAIVSVGSSKPLLEQLRAQELLVRTFGPLYKDFQEKDLAKRSELGHTGPPLPPKGQ